MLVYSTRSANKHWRSRHTLLNAFDWQEAMKFITSTMLLLNLGQCASTRTVYRSDFRHAWKFSTLWGRVTHRPIWIGNLTIIVSDNGLSPGRRQAIIWTSAGILFIGPKGTKFHEILIETHTFSFKTMHLKMSSAKWRPFCLGLNVLMLIGIGKESSFSTHHWLILLLTCGYEQRPDTKHRIRNILMREYDHDKHSWSYFRRLTIHSAIQY